MKQVGGTVVEDGRMAKMGGVTDAAAMVLIQRFQWACGGGIAPMDGCVGGCKHGWGWGDPVGEWRSGLAAWLSWVS